MAKKYYEGTVKIKAYVTYGVHADSKEEAYRKIAAYLDEESVDMWDVELDEWDFDESDVYEENESLARDVVNIDEEEEE